MRKKEYRDPILDSKRRPLSCSERKLERLDDAFLFIISLVGLLFSITQAYVAGMGGLVEISPLLLLGVIMPFYVGYVRGAISIDSVNHSVGERMRGWVYLVIGVGTYIGYMLSIRAPPLIPAVNPLLVLWGTYYPPVLVSSGVTYFILWKWFVNIFGVGKAISQQYSFFGTVASVFLLTFVLRMFASMYSDLSGNPQYSPLLALFLWFTWSIAMVFVIFEKLSRHLINATLQLDAVQIEKHQRPNVLKRFIIYYAEMQHFTFASEVNLGASWSWLSGLTIGALGLCLFIFKVPILSEAYLLVSAVFLTRGTVYSGRCKRLISPNYHARRSRSEHITTLNI